MRQRWLLNIALLGAVLILGTLVYTLEQKEPAELPKLTTLEADKVQNIRIERADAEPISLLKDNLGLWQVTAPFKLPANSFRVERLLKILAERNYQKLEADNLNLAEFKLEPPLASIKFDQLTVAYGDNSPMNDGKRYLLVNQNVYLVTDTVYHSIIDDALVFANLSPLGNNSKITELKMPDYHLVLKEGQWMLLSSTFSTEEIDTSKDKLNALIENWQNASAYKVQRYDAKEAAIGKIEITLLGKEQPRHLTIVTKSPNLVLAWPAKGVQYQFTANQVNKLLHLPTKNKPADPTDITAPPPPVPAELQPSAGSS